MSDIEWGTRTPGNDVMLTKNDPNMSIIGQISLNDWVKLPDNLGGARVQVQAITKTIGCPGCLKHHFAYVLPDNIIVFDCVQINQFLWARIAPPTSE